MHFQTNLCTFDRALRFTIGVVCIYLGFFEGSLIPNGLVAALIGLFGVINLFACFTSYCPVYSACGFTTRRSKKQQETN